MRTLILSVLGLLPLVGCHHRVPVEAPPYVVEAPQEVPREPWYGLAIVDLSGEVPHVALLITAEMITQEVLEDAVVLTGVQGPDGSWIFIVPSENIMFFDRVEIDPSGLLMASRTFEDEGVIVNWLIVKMVSESGYTLNYAVLSGGRTHGDLYKVDLNRARCEGERCAEFVQLD